MAVEIPPEVADFLDCCGVRYPDIDEGDVRGLAVKVRTFAANTRAPGADESADALAEYQRLVASWTGANGDHQAELDRVCAIIAKALDAVAYVITVTKAVVLTELAALATTYAAMTATPAARIAGPLVAAAARRLCAQMERALIGYLVIEVIGRAVEPLGRDVDRLFTGTASVRASPAEQAREPGMPGVPAVEPGTACVPNTASRMPGVLEAEPEMPDVSLAEPQLSGVTAVESQLPGTATVEPRMPAVVSGGAPTPSAVSGGAPTPSATPGVPHPSDAVPAEPPNPGAAPAGDAAVTGSRAVQVGPRIQPSPGPSRSRGFVTPWAHAVRASAQRAAFSKGVPAKAFQSLDRRATTARKPRETPWSKLARQSETTSEELAATVPTVRHREDGDR
ncbi:hypothetical protein ACQPXH_11310 [Nocardia sp. CA-135953]|uniref:hypothetical protein n=1 Tax=Nocardia sp. CA-135953 TaxID=3239978 RepID=UPI003D97ECD6